MICFRASNQRCSSQCVILSNLIIMLACLLACLLACRCCWWPQQSVRPGCLQRRPLPHHESDLGGSPAKAGGWDDQGRGMQAHSRACIQSSGGVLASPVLGRPTPLPWQRTARYARACVRAGGRGWGDFF